MQDCRLGSSGVLCTYTPAVYMYTLQNFMAMPNGTRSFSCCGNHSVVKFKYFDNTYEAVGRYPNILVYCKGNVPLDL